MPERRSHDCVRSGTTTLFAALDTATGKVIGSLHRRHRTAEFKKFPAELGRQVPADLEVRLILDNHITHEVPAIKTWLVAHPRFHLHFTPIGSSWLNLVERWFAELTQKELRRGVHRSVQALERDIHTWLADWNDHPRPFTRTETADEILDEVAAHHHRISDQGHQFLRPGPSSPRWPSSAARRHRDRRRPPPRGGGPGGLLWIRRRDRPARPGHR
ncbi:DDE superfamily endonuclease [Kitasatospora sp. SolWspMP-SS2h]|uniref:IS630 family transposase n=1 Tax=Kitasatospora sp. SolWspMP-SS2h TaxID=1305729 RepID=UPI000DBFEE7F|nr:IS630 family transposase [Kitasatospora sp. SolWspMP-SS2h]RAJ31797.1 DDE superfamily endonuclease [Kitasatospora sp. SolWspMP-SS2h]